MYRKVLWLLLQVVPPAGDALDRALQLRVVRWLGPRAVVVSVRDLHEVLPLASAMIVQVQHHRRWHQLIAQSRYKNDWAPDSTHFLLAVKLDCEIFG